MNKNEKQSLWSVVKRALCLRCPNCGKGKLFKSYLKQVDCCGECGEEFGHIRADDGPAWLTVLLVGHIVVPLSIYVEIHNSLKIWESMTIWPLLIVSLILAFLPSAKGFFISVIWHTGCIGSEK